ncbi:TonB-dependent receptor [Pedobacter sp. Du54]|uniref:TonB-dependent receptor domain-containing protein n=1 Tax=Pedobacter anseongensis TaxID=3133439 RepID=UPI0030A3C283
MYKFILIIACFLACGASFAQNSGKADTHAADTTKAKTPAINQLKTVSIEAKKSFVEHRADKTIINVENSLVASGGTALEVLEKAPGVSIDRQNEQIKLNNKSGIMVMIDGKTNALSGADITAMLSNMSSDQIASIELITNPSAKYDAAGNAGIINIKLKRNKSFGTNGTLSLNTGQGIMPNAPSDLYRLGLQLTLNHRVNKWNVFSTTAFNRKVGYNTINVARTTLTSNLASAFDQNFDRNNTGFAYMGKVGADYYASEKTIFGVMIDANAIYNNLNNYSSTIINETRELLNTQNLVNQQAYSKSPIRNLTANFNIRHEFKKQGSNLTVDVDYSGFSNNKDEKFDAQYTNDASELDKTTALMNNTKANIDVYAAKTDFVFPISKTLKLEAGLKSSYVLTNNDFISSEFKGGAWQNDKGKSNNFIYKENINALYTSFSKDWEKWKIQVGLRAEHTHSNGNSITAQKQVDRNYLSLFPTVFINQSLTKNHNIRYSYSRRVDRPNYQQLNPFVFYMDPFAVDEGNPYLKPQFTDNLEIGYSYKEVSFSLNYADTRDMITQISQQNDSTRIINVIRKNLGRAQNYSANVYVPTTIAKFWKMYTNLSLYFNKFDDNNLEGAAFTANKVAYNLNSTHSITLPKDFAFEVNFWLNSPRINGVEETTITQYALNAGLQKSMMDKKLKIRVGIDDIFLTNRWEGKLAYQNVNLQVVNRYLSRRASFTVNYNFGNQNVKSARNRNTATEDLKNRAN